MFKYSLNLLKIFPAGVYHGIIWFLSNQQLHLNLHGFDKTAHITEYSGLGFLLAFGLSLKDHDFDNKAKGCLLFGALIGITDELHQAFVPTRSMDFIDFTADIVGISIGILCWLLFFKMLSFLNNEFKTKNQEAQDL